MVGLQKALEKFTKKKGKPGLILIDDGDKLVDHYRDPVLLADVGFMIGAYGRSQLADVFLTFSEHASVNIWNDGRRCSS